ncbi:MAG: SMC-Scp complex subunit ScpB [Bryobacterales bacterium]|nr:SMC-Scp complex subunit ScpB [Bryobacterales bacterium]
MEPEEVQPPQEAVDEPLTSEGAEPAPAEEQPAPAEEQPATETEQPAAEEPAAEEPPAAENEESGEEAEPVPMELSDVELKAILEAVIYITDEPLEAKQIAQALQQPLERVEASLAELVVEFSRPERGLQIREIAGGFKMATKPEHHEAVRQFVKNLKPSFKLTGAALETLAVIAYKQPITAPEIMEIRGVQGAGVLKTLVERKLITTAGRKNVIGKPILYKTTKDFLVQFGLKSVNELPTLKEFEELRRLAFSEDEMPEEAEGPASAAEAAAAPPAEPVAVVEPEPLPEAAPAPEPEPEQETAPEIEPKAEPLHDTAPEV